MRFSRRRKMLHCSLALRPQRALTRSWWMLCASTQLSVRISSLSSRVNRSTKTKKRERTRTTRSVEYSLSWLTYPSPRQSTGSRQICKIKTAHAQTGTSGKTASYSCFSSTTWILSWDPLIQRVSHLKLKLWRLSVRSCSPSTWAGSLKRLPLARRQRQNNSLSTKRILLGLTWVMFCWLFSRHGTKIRPKRIYSSWSKRYQRYLATITAKRASTSFFWPSWLKSSSCKTKRSWRRSKQLWTRTEAAPKTSFKWSFSCCRARGCSTFRTLTSVKPGQMQHLSMMHRAKSCKVSYSVEGSQCTCLPCSHRSNSRRWS